MSDIIISSYKEVSKRKLEADAGKGVFAVQKMVIATLYKNLVYETTQRNRTEVKEWLTQVRQMIRNLVELAKVCSEKDLKEGRGIYANPYYLSGVNVDYAEIDRRVKKGELPSHAGYFGEKEHLEPLLHRLDSERAKYNILLHRLKEKEEEGTLADHDRESQLHYTKALQSSRLNPLSFDADPRAAQKFTDFMKTLMLGDFQIDELSKKNIADAYLLAKKEGKKLVLNCNHSGHTDANLLGVLWSYLVEEGIIPHEKDMPQEYQMKLRLLCGFYMATTPGIRTHLVGSNVLLVPGINDMDYFKANLGNKLLAKLFKEVERGFGADPDREVMIMFPGAGRGEYGGLKDRIPAGSERYIHRPDCVYCNVHFTGSDNMYAAFENTFTVFNRFTPQKVRVMFGEPYVGGTKKTEEIFQEMVAQRDILQPQWKGAERVYQAQKKEISSLEELAEHLMILARYGDKVSEYEKGNINPQELSPEVEQLIEKNNRLIAQVTQARDELVFLLQHDELGEHAKQIKVARV